MLTHTWLLLWELTQWSGWIIFLHYPLWLCVQRNIWSWKWDHEVTGMKGAEGGFFPPSVRDWLSRRRMAGGVFNYSRLNSDNLFHILEVFLTAFGVMPLHVLIWLRRDNVGFPQATTISRCFQKGTLQRMTTQLESDRGNYYAVNRVVP